MKTSSTPSDSYQLAIFLSQPRYINQSDPNLIKSVLIEKRSLLELLQELHNIPAAQRSSIDSDGNLFGEVPSAIFSQKSKDFILNPKVRFQELLHHAFVKTNSTSYSPAEIEFEGCKNLEQYLQYLDELKLITETDYSRIREIFSPSSSSSSSVVASPSLAETIALVDGGFFKEFVSHFKTLRTNCAFAFEQTRFTNLQNPIFTEEVSVAQHVTELKIRRLPAGKKRPELTDERFSHDTSGNFFVEDQDIKFSETIGSEMSRQQEDAFIIGESQIVDSETAATELTNAFRRIGTEIRQKVPDLFMGSTAIVAHYSPDQNLTVVNCGDSRAVLFLRNTDTNEINSTRLSHDHSPDDVFEHARITNLGGKIERGRVVTKYSLAIARSFGDSTYQATKRDSQTINHLISFEPDIYEYNISRSLEDGFEAYLLVSCDGLYTEFGENRKSLNEESYANALKMWFHNENHEQEKYKNNIAHYLQDFAIINASTDNVTVCFTNITNAPAKPFMIGVFDGHGGDVISQTLACEIGNQFLCEENKLVYPIDAKSVLQMTAEETQSITSSQETVVLDEDELGFDIQENSQSANDTTTATLQEPILKEGDTDKKRKREDEEEDQTEKPSSHPKAVKTSATTISAAIYRT